VPDVLPSSAIAIAKYLSIHLLTGDSLNFFGITARFYDATKRSNLCLIVFLAFERYHFQGGHCVKKQSWLVKNNDNAHLRILFDKGLGNCRSSRTT
jgi:hypothetical protein